MVCGQESLTTIVEVLVNVLVVSTSDCCSNVCLGLLIIEAWSEVIWVLVCHYFSKMCLFQFKL